MEEELVEQLTSKDSGLGGMLRIAGYSSIVRSVLIPALAPLLRDNPNERRVVLQIWDAQHDLGTQSKDIPCNLMIKLYVNVHGELATPC